MKMTDWASFLDRFLELSDYPILDNRGGRRTRGQAQGRGRIR